MSLERMKKDGEKRRSGAVEGALAALALFNAADHGPAHALELPPETSWEAGVGKIRNAVMHEKNESQTSFVVFADKTTAWPKVTEGTEHNVKYTHEGVRNYVLKKRGTRNVEVHCDIHTHPVASTFFKTPKGETFSYRYSPPSPTDIRSAALGGLEELTVPYKISVNRSEHAVADPQGLWYYSGTKALTISEKDAEEWQKKMRSFAKTMAFDKNADFQTEHKKVQEAYREHFKAEVRFVSYADLSKEPICAGVDYKPAQESVSGATKTQKPEISAERVDTNQRPSLRDLNAPLTRRRLDDQGPPYHVGLPQR